MKHVPKQSEIFYLARFWRYSEFLSLSCPRITKTGNNVTKLSYANNIPLEIFLHGEKIPKLRKIECFGFSRQMLGVDTV